MDEPLRAPANSMRRGHLAVQQRRAVTAGIELNGDAIVLVSSWEERATEVCAARAGGFRRSAVVRFSETGRSGRRAAHDPRLLEFAKSVSDEVADWDSLPVRDFFGWRDQIAEFIADVSKSLGRPIDLVVDITCLPKYYALLILGFTLKAGIVRSIRFFYAEGKYAPRNANSLLSSDHAFTHGNWSSFPVPYLEGELRLDRKIQIIASVGFETFQARKFIRTYEAERHFLITPFPGFVSEYEQRSENEAHALASNLDVASQEIRRAPAGGVIETSMEVLAILDGNIRYNQLGLCLGTKPQALGMGVAAELRPEFTLVCRIPEEYAETETPSLGMSWRYDVTDLSVVPIV